MVNFKRVFQIFRYLESSTSKLLLEICGLTLPLLLSCGLMNDFTSWKLFSDAPNLESKVVKEDTSSAL